MNSKVTVALLAGIALTSALAGCGSHTPVASGHHKKHVKHHTQVAPKSSDPSVSASASTSVSQPSGPHDFSSWPTKVAAGAPKPAQKFHGVVGSSGPLILPPPPSGGLAGANGQAATWAIGQAGAVVLFMNPSNSLDAWDIKYAWVPAAQKYDTSLDLVDIVPTASIANVGKPPASPSDFNRSLFSNTGVPANGSQSLAQMAKTMAEAKKKWQLPSWVHIYEISAQTAAAWGLEWGLAAYSGSANQSDPTAWIFAPPFSANNYTPSLSAGIPGADMSPAKVLQAVNQTVGNLP